jgi:hypothetical protein
VTPDLMLPNATRFAQIALGANSVR